MRPSRERACGREHGFHKPGNDLQVTLRGKSYFGSGQNDLSADGSNTLGYSSQGLYTTIKGSNRTTYSRTPNGQLVDERTSTGTYDYLYDGEGNVVGLTDSSDHLVDQYAYDPYGNKTTSTGSVSNPDGFQGGYTASNGLIHFGDRFYNPLQRSWTQQDPAGYGSYSYAGYDPVNGTDPAGLQSYYISSATAFAWGVAAITYAAGVQIGQHVSPSYISGILTRRSTSLVEASRGR